MALITKRTFLIQLAGAGLTVLLPARVGAADSGVDAARRSFRFTVINDLHIGDSACEPFLEGLVAHLRGHADVDFCLVVGDLADKGEPHSLTAVRDAFSRHALPMYPVPGNHDCDREKNTRIYSEIFPGRTHYTFVHHDWQFVGFDSTEGNAWGDTRISDEALAFLDTTSRQLEPARPTVVFTHFPLGAGVKMAPRNVGAALDRLAPLNVRAAFCGHYHAATETRHREGVLLTTPCCSRLRANHDGTLAEGYVLCTAHADGRLERQFIAYSPAFEQPVQSA